MLTPGVYNAAYVEHALLARLNGAADDKLVYTSVTDLIRYYLGEEPHLDNVETHRLETPEVLEWVLGHLDSLVLKPVDGSGGKGIVIVIGPAAEEEEELDALRAVEQANPHGWIAQRPVALSTAPTLVGDTIAPRHVDLRPFAVNDGNDIWVLPGGLTRVALPEGALVVNSSQGGGSKDTWVLAHDPEEQPDSGDAEALAGAMVRPPSGPFPQIDGVRRDPGPADAYAGQQ